MSRVYSPGGFSGTFQSYNPGLNAGFRAATSLGPLFAGWVPFDINLLSWSGRHVGPASQGGVTAQNRVGGALVGNPLSLVPGAEYGTLFDPPILIPAVTTGNIDGAARWGLDLTGINLTTFLWDYEAADDANAGRQIMSIGGVRILTPTCETGHVAGESHLFAPLVNPYLSEVIADAGDTGPYFILGYETLPEWNVPLQAGFSATRRPAATQPWLTPGVMGGFRFVLDAAPTADFSVAFRQNQTTVFTIDITAGSQRIWLPTGDPTVTVRQGDLLCWQCLTAGAYLDGQLLWWFERGMPSGGFNTQGFNLPGFGGGGPV